MESQTPILRELTAADEVAFFAGVDSWQGEELAWHTFDWTPGMAFADLLERLCKNRLGIDLKPGHIPSTMLYGFVDQTIVGRVSVRHELNDYLRRIGGHMGYAVAPAFRRRGFALAMARQGIDACRALGLRRILVTANDNNEPSWRIIERLGGVFECVIDDNGKSTRRYWIDL